MCVHHHQVRNSICFLYKVGLSLRSLIQRKEVLLFSSVPALLAANKVGRGGGSYSKITHNHVTPPPPQVMGSVLEKDFGSPPPQMCTKLKIWAKIHREGRLGG